MPTDELDFEKVREDNDRYFRTLTRFREARVALFFRSFLSLAAILFGLFLVYSWWDDVSYLFLTPNDPIPLGNLRSDKFDPDSLTSLKSNDYVSFENDIILYNEIKSADGTYTFYYSPITHFVVKTPQQIPAKDQGGVYAITEGELKWIVNRQVFPEDLSVSINCHGRVVKAEDAPDWTDSVFEFMSNSSEEPISSMYYFMDGDFPSSYGIYGILFVVAVVLVVLTVVFWLRSFQKFLVLRREAAQVKSESLKNEEMSPHA